MSDDALVGRNAALADRVEEERRARRRRRHFVEDAKLRGVGRQQFVAGVVVFLGLALRGLRRAGTPERKRAKAAVTVITKHEAHHSLPGSSRRRHLYRRRRHPAAVTAPPSQPTAVATVACRHRRMYADATVSAGTDAGCCRVDAAQAR